MAKILVVSDLHYDRRFYHGVNESRAWQWLLSIVDFHKPDLLIGLGDWGGAVNEGKFYELLRRVRTWAIYGNHDKLDVLGKLYNVLVGGCEPVLMADGEIREFGGIVFGAINGIVALRKKMRKGVPRKLPEEFVEIAKKLAGRIDVLLMHDSPKLPLPEYRGYRGGCPDAGRRAGY
jgi:predicted phosphodiesterase